MDDRRRARVHRHANLHVDNELLRGYLYEIRQMALHQLPHAELVRLCEFALARGNKSQQEPNHVRTA